MVGECFTLQSASKLVGGRQDLVKLDCRVTVRNDSGPNFSSFFLELVELSGVLTSENKTVPL